MSLRDDRTEFTYMLKLCGLFLAVALVLFCFMALNLVDVLIWLIVGGVGIIGVGAVAIWLDDRNGRREDDYLRRQEEQRARVAEALQKPGWLEPFELDPFEE